MLIVTNGRSAVDSLDQAGIPGDKLPWNDVLHDGPVPGDAAPAGLADVRARFLAGCGWGDEATIRRDLQARDERLAAAVSHGEEIVLWFEHDLYDQLQVLQALDRLHDAAGRETRVMLICRARYVSEERPDDLRALFAQRSPVSAAEYGLARRAWAAFGSRSPEGLVTLSRGADAALPYLPAAFRRLLEQFPDVRTGLSRSERQALEALRALGGRAQSGAVFRMAQHTEEPRFLGDASFDRYVAGLAAGPAPLLEVVDSGSRRVLAITAQGTAVLDGRVDWLAGHPIDRWVGGTHLRPGRVWRWDAAAASLVRTPA